MMSFPELSLAILALLVTRGPTHALVLLAGATRGLRGAAWLISAEPAGYLLTVVPLSLVGAALLARYPGLQAGVTIATAIWVAVLALRLWRLPDAVTDAPSVDGRALFVTTALSPKALIFGVVLLPSPDRLATNLASFVILVVLVALAWAALGASLRGRGVGQPRALFVLRRLASVVLAVMSLMLAARGLGA